jgi:putative membrane protein
MDMMRGFALTIHVVGFSMWQVGLFLIAAILVARDDQPEEAVRTRFGQWARRAGIVADLGATLAILGGIGLITIAPTYYLHQPWLHMKLTVVLAVLGLHGFLRAKAKRASLGQGTFPKAIVPAMTAILLVVIALAVLKPLAR